MVSASEPGSRRRRWWWLAMAAGASAVVIALGSADWYRVGTVRLSGRQVTGDLVPVLGYAALALVGLGLTLKGRGQRLAAVALFALGVGQVITGWTRHRPGAAQLSEWGASGTGAPTQAWVVLVAAGFLTCGAALGLAASVATAGDRMERFDRRTSAPADPSLAAWRAMDAGLDPTAEDDAAYLATSERGNLSRSRFTSEDEGPDLDQRADRTPTQTQRKGRDD